MVTAFYILLFLSIWHFFYESVLSSSLRHGLRYKFFELRDNLRNIKIDNSLTEKDKLIYDKLDNSICNMINSMSFISIGNYYKFKSNKARSNKFFSEIKQIKKLIQSADNKDLIEIDDKIGKLGAKALIINHGGYFVYFIIPLLLLGLVAVLIAVSSDLLDKCKKMIIKVSSRLIYSSDVNNSSNLGLA